MTKLCRAEATLIPDLDCSPETLAAAKLAGQLAAKQAGRLAPFGPEARLQKIEIEIAVALEEIRVFAAVEADQGGEAGALFAAAAAAQTLADLARAAVQSIRPSGQVKETLAANPFPRKPVVSAPKRAGVKPSTLMGEVIGPKPPAAHADRREAFRNFMTGNHLRITDWAEEAGVPVGVVYAFLTGSAGSIPTDAAEKLAHTAGVTVEDLFRG